MKQHDIYKNVVTLDDFTDQGQAHITDSISRIFDGSDEVALAESSNGTAQIQVPSTIPTVNKPNVRQTIEYHLEASLRAHERIVLNQRVLWPEPRYEICIDFD